MLLIAIKKAYTILKRNYRFGKSELDIIACNEKFSIFWRLGQGKALILMTLNPLFKKNNITLTLLLLAILLVQITWLLMLGLIS